MSRYASENGNKVTVRTFLQKKEKGEPIAMLTAYDYPTARALRTLMNHWGPLAALRGGTRFPSSLLFSICSFFSRLVVRW
jgi:hypothetical protein